MVTSVNLLTLIGIDFSAWVESWISVIQELLEIGVFFVWTFIIIFIIVAIMVIGVKLFSQGLGVVNSYTSIYDKIEKHTEIDVSDLLKSAVIGGIIGGIVFASMSPIIIPKVSDAQVRSGIIDQPAPLLIAHGHDHDRYFQPGPLGEEAVSGASVSGNQLKSDEIRYFFSIRNKNEVPISDLRIRIQFAGCIEDSGLAMTAFMNPTVDVIFLSEFVDQNNSENWCAEELYIDELPAQTQTQVYFVIDTDPEEQTLYSHREELRNGDVVISACEYNFDFNGQQYAVDSSSYKINFDSSSGTISGPNWARRCKGEVETGPNPPLSINQLGG